MMEEKTAVAAEEVGEYARYPEGFEKLLKELKFPSEDENFKKMILKTTISSLLHY